jgi:Ca2+/Na+ antiporter
MLASALIALVALLTSVIVQSIAIDLNVRFVAWALMGGHAGRSFLRNVGVVTAVMLVLMTALLAQVAVWAAAFVICGALPDLATAFYHSAVNFTTLGYGDIVMPADWRLLGPVEAANGVLMCGVSASAMFAVTHRLLEIRLHRELRMMGREAP